MSRDEKPTSNELSVDEILQGVIQAREDRWQAYFWPGTDVLQNKLGILETHRLQEQEFRYSKSREQDLYLHPEAVPRSLDLDHIRGIHRYLFQDVYEWAGELRSVDMQKDRVAFARISSLTETANALFQDLKEHDYLKHLPKNVFVDASAQVFNELNKLHPFREGNGRTQRVFMEHLAHEAGYVLDFKTVSKAAVIGAAVAGARGELGPYRFLLAKRLEPRVPDITVLHCQADKKELAITFAHESSLEYLVRRGGYVYRGSESVDQGQTWNHVFVPSGKGPNVHTPASRHFMAGVTVELSSKTTHTIASRDMVFLDQADAQELQTLQRVRLETKSMAYQHSMSRDGRAWIHIYAQTEGPQTHVLLPIPASSHWVPHTPRLEIDSVRHYGADIQRALNRGADKELGLSGR